MVILVGALRVRRRLLRSLGLDGMRSLRAIAMGRSPLLHSATGRDIMRSARAPERACSATLHRPGRPPGGAVALGLHTGRTIHPPSEYRFLMIRRFRPPWAALLCATPRSLADTNPKHDQRANHLEHQPFGKPEPISRRKRTDLGAELDRSRGGLRPISANPEKPQSVRPARTSPTQARATTKSLSLVPAGTTTGRASNRG